MSGRIISSRSHLSSSGSGPDITHTRNNGQTVPHSVLPLVIYLLILYLSTYLSVNTIFCDK